MSQTKWEYKTVEFANNGIQELNENLNESGQEGWDLVIVYENGMKAVYKRELGNNNLFLRALQLYLDANEKSLHNGGFSISDHVTSIFKDFRWKK